MKGQELVIPGLRNGKLQKIELRRTQAAPVAASLRPDPAISPADAVTGSGSVTVTLHNVGSLDASGVLVEIWHWTPLVMLIVLGGLASLPTEPYESARLDGASEWQLFRYVTLPLIMPFLIVAAVIRTIDAVKAFDTIYVISQGGPGTASETINLYLYLQAFAFYNVGNASAVVVVFFAIIVALALLLLHVRERARWAN